MYSLKAQLLSLLLASASLAAPQNFLSRNDGGFTDGGSFGGFSSGGFVDGGSISSGGGSFIGGSSGSFSSGGGSSFIGGSSGGGLDSGNFITVADSGCPFGQAKDSNGNCARAKVTRSLYLFGGVPAQQIRVNPAGPLPEPKIHYNYVFVKAPEVTGGATPLVAPAQQQKTIVYVLAKNPDSQQQQVIEVQSNPTRPDVFFIRHDGQNLNQELPGGIDLRTALAQAEQTGQVIDVQGGVGSAGGLSGGQLLGGSSGQLLGGGLQLIGGSSGLSGGLTGGQLLSSDGGLLN